MALLDVDDIGVRFGGVVALDGLSFTIDAAIITYIRREYGIAIGEQTAEEIKILIGSAHPTPDEVRAEVRGRELMSGLPKTVILSAPEVRGAIAEPVNTMVDSVLSCVAEAPPELAQDLIERGINLVGGGSLLKGLDLRLAKESEVPVQLVRQPLESGVLGAGRVIESFEALKVMFMDAKR